MVEETSKRVRFFSSHGLPKFLRFFFLSFFMYVEIFSAFRCLPPLPFPPSMPLRIDLGIVSAQSSVAARNRSTEWWKPVRSPLCEEPELSKWPRKKKEKKPLTIKGYCRTLHRRDIFRRTTRPPSRLMRSFVRRPYAFSLIGEPQRKKMANRAEPSTLSQTTVYSYEQLEPGRPVLKRNTSTENKREARKDEQTLPRNCFNMPRSIWHTQAGAFA